MNEAKSAPFVAKFLAGYALSALLAVVITAYSFAGIAQAKPKVLSPAGTSLSAIISSGVSPNPLINPSGQLGNLYSPTYMVFLEGKWFIIDCWNNRVLWTNDPNQPIVKWSILDDQLGHPHSIAYGDGVYAVEDTEGAKLNLYKFNDGSGFTKVDSVELAFGSRPHRTVFDSSTKTFLTLGSMNQTLYRVDAKLAKPQVTESYSLGFLGGNYARSFTLVQDKLFFVSELQFVVEGQIESGQVVEKQRYAVPSEFKSANDLFFTGQGFIMTATIGESGKGAIGVVSNLSDLPNLKDQSRALGFRSVPYYISQYDDKVIVPELSSYSAIKLLELKDDNTLTGQFSLYDFGRSKRL